MNVGLLQFVNSNISTSNVTKSNNASSLNSETKFGDVFTNIISLEKNATVDVDDNNLDKDFLSSLLNVNSLEEMFELLNISNDGSFITVDQNVKNFDELMNLDDLLSILGIDYSELQKILGGLMGEEVATSSNIWQIIEQINENAEQIISQLQLSFNGEQSITPKQSQQFVAFLKLAQLVGNQTDLVMDQPLQLVQLKEMVETVVKEILVIKSSDNNLVQTTMQNVQHNTAQNFQQVVEKVIQISNDNPDDTNDNATFKDNSQTGVNQQQSVTTKTVTIQLPTDKGNQAEELVNRIERLLNQSQISKNQGIIKFQVKLFPENLGSIRIELTSRDGVLTARLLTTTTIAKEMLDSQLHQLKNAFVQQNIQLDRIDIQQAIQDKDLRDQNLFNNFFNQQNQQNEENEEEQDSSEQEQDSKSFHDYLMDVEV